MTNKLPTLADLAALCKEAKRTIKSFGEKELDLTVGWNPTDSSWNYQTGDNQYMGSAYGYPIWAVTTVTSSTNCREEARFLQDQLAELYSQNEEEYSE